MKDKILQKLETNFKSWVESASEYRGELTIVVAKDKITDVCRYLRDDQDLQFDSLRDLCGADYYRPEGRFEVVYNLYSLKNKYRLRLKARLEETNTHIATVSDIWPTADWHEREAYDMYGIIFDGHPDLRRIYLPEEFEHYPLRKDFPLMGIPGSLHLPRK